MHWSGVSICTKDGRLKAGPLRGDVAQKISSLVLICDVKTWFLKKGSRDKTVSDTGLFLCTDRVFDFVPEPGWFRVDPLSWNRYCSKKSKKRYLRDKSFPILFLALKLENKKKEKNLDDFCIFLFDTEIKEEWGNLIYIYILDFSRLCRLHEVSKASGLLSLRSCTLSSEAEAHNIEASF